MKENISKIIGTYAIHEVLVDFHQYLNDTVDYDITIEPSSIDSFDIQFFEPIHIMDTVRAVLINDSAFQIKTNWFFYPDEEDTFSLTIFGEGYIHQDSITINHRLGGLFTSYIGYGKGIRKNGTGIKRNNDVDLKVFTYPNPAKYTITVVMPQNTITNNVELFDLSGHKIQQWRDLGFGKNTLQLKSVLPGIYLLKIETESGIKSEKIVIQ